MRALLPRSAWTVLALALYAGPAPGQFSAKGRQRPAPTTPASQPQRQNPRPAASSSPTAQRDILIARYEKLLLQQPGQPAVLSRLMELVRQRDGHLQELAKQLEALAARGGDDGYAGAMALAGIALEEGRQDDARQQFARARDMAPRRPEALVALAQLKASAGELEQAKADYERAAVLSHGLERQAIVRSLRDLSLEQGDLAAARAYHRKLTGAARGNVYLEGELARELLRRGQFDEAIAEAKRVAEANVGDNRALAPALRELGEAQLAASRFDDAKRSLERAARLSQNQPGLQLMIEGLLAEAHRGAGTLPEYLSQLSQTATRTDQLMLLGRLYEQAGRTDEAIKVYRQAAQRSPQDPDPRLSLVRLLELTSELKEATTQYQRLTRIAPKQTDLSLRYIELLLTQGERDAALREFDRTSRNARSDPDAALLLLDLAQRIGESARADALVRSLEANGHLQPQHLVELGSRAFRKGDEAHALSLWRRILDCSGKPEALSVTYGETLLGHEQLELGLSALQKAAEQAPDDSDVRRALARGYLRAASQSSGSRKQSYEQAALREWTRLLSVGTSQAADQSRRAEARRQVVRLFERTGQLEQRTRELQKEYQKNPSALETGRLLAQAQLEQGAPNQAEGTLRAMLKVAPADREALHLLDQVQLEQGNLRASMETLKQLVRVNPSEAASLYETLSQRAMQLPDDALALRYAELAFERDQGSAEAQARLGDLYADQGEFARATEAYRAALAKNDRMNAVALRLAELLTKQGESQEALDLLLRVVRSARSDEELSQAGRTALTVGLFSGQARKLEDELRPLAIAMPARKPVRDLLLEVIAAEMLPLTKQLDYGSPEQRDQAASELLQLSLRCLPPLLVALSEGEPGQQQLAITALRYGTSESAGTALLEFAVSAAPEALRVEAVLAAGRHEDARLVGRFRRLLQGDDGPRRGRLARAALLGLAVIDTPAAHSAIQLGLASADPNLRVESLLVLGDQPQLLSDDELLATLTQSSSGPGPRAAAALALATRRADPAIASELRRAATDRHRLVRASALHALCALRPPDESGIELAARALYEPDEQLSQAALASLALSASPTEASRPLLESTLSADQLNERRLQIRGEELLWRKLLVTPSAEARAKALTKNQQYILAGATLSLRTSKASARKLQGFLRTSDDDSSLVPFFRKAADGPLLDEALRKDAEASSRALRTALVPLLVEHAQAADPETRAAALRSLQLSQGPNARAAIKSGLFSSEPLAVEAALDALRAGPADDAIDLLDELQSQETHQERPGSQSRRIAQLLETLGQQTEGASREQACDLLRRLAQNSEGLARSRALSALETLGAFER